MNSDEIITIIAIIFACIIAIIHLLACIIRCQENRSRSTLVQTFICLAISITSMILITIFVFSNNGGGDLWILWVILMAFLGACALISCILYETVVFNFSYY